MQGRRHWISSGTCRQVWGSATPISSVICLKHFTVIAVVALWFGLLSNFYSLHVEVLALYCPVYLINLFIYSKRRPRWVHFHKYTLVFIIYLKDYFTNYCYFFIHRLNWENTKCQKKKKNQVICTENGTCGYCQATKYSRLLNFVYVSWSKGARLASRQSLWKGREVPEQSHTAKRDDCISKKVSLTGQAVTERAVLRMHT